MTLVGTSLAFGGKSLYAGSMVFRNCLGMALLSLALTAVADPDPRRIPLESEEWDAMAPARGVAPHRPSQGVRLPSVQGRNGFTLYQVNVNASGQDIVGDAANEPSLAIDVANPLRMAIGWRQFDSVASNFRQAGYAYTTNGGVTWNFPARIEPGVFRSDPVLATGPDGRFYYNSLTNAGAFGTDQWRSPDGGQTYQRLGGSFGGDKQWITIDTTNSVGRGHQYQSWSTASNPTPGLQFNRSTDGGTTWSTPVAIPTQGIWGTLDVDNSGRLFLGLTNSSRTFYCVRSSNARFAAQTPTFDLTTTISLNNGAIGFNLPINPAGLAGQVSLVVDKSTGPTAGNVYLLCSVGPNTSNPLDVYFVRSTNGGTSFSTPRRLNTDPTGQGAFHWFGTLSVAPNGRLDAVWLDTREDVNDRLSALYWTNSLDGGVTWAPEIAVTDTFNPNIGYPQQNKIGDYLGLVGLNDAAYCVFPTTFNGGQDLSFVRLPAPPATVRGTLTLNDWIPDESGQLATWEVRAPGGSVVLASGSMTLGAAGAYTANLPGQLAGGTYDFDVKGSRWISRRVASLAVPLTGVSGVNRSLVNGDVDGDDDVTILDFLILSANFGGIVGNAGVDPRPDLDGDNEISILDYLILSANYGVTGPL